MTPGSAKSNRIIALSTLSVAGLWTVLALLTWSDLANGPRVSSPFTTFGYGQALLFSGPVQWLPICAAVLVNAAAVLIGYYYLVGPLWGSRSLASEIWLVLAGAVPGMLLIAATSRIVTLFVGHALAPAIILLASMGAAAFAIVHLRRLRYSVVPRSQTWKRILPAVAALVAALVFQIHIDRAHAVAEGSIWFIQNLFLSDAYGPGSLGRWPIISQHYDEAAFLYAAVYGFLAMGPDASGTLSVMYWITLAVGRLGMISLTFVALRGLGLDRLSALVTVALVCAASLSLNPVSSRVLFDSLSPLGYAFHMSRYLVPVAPLLILSAAASPRNPTARAFVIAMLMGTGLASMPIHTGVVIGWAVALAILTALNSEAAAAPRFWQATCIAALTSLLGFSIAYGVQSLAAVHRVVVLVASALFAAAFMAWTALRARRPGVHSPTGLPPSIVLVTTAAYGLALVLLGNVGAHRFAPYLAKFWPWAGLPILDRLSDVIVNPQLAVTQSPYCTEGFEWGYRVLTGHCGTLQMFVRTYGFTFVAMATAVAIFLLRLPAKPVNSIRVLTLLAWGLALCLFGLPFGFVLYDFVSASTSPVEWHRTLSIWLRSRLVEPWFIGGILLAITLLLREARERERRWMQTGMLIAVAIFTLNPFVLPGQIAANFAYLFYSLLPFR